MRSICSYKVHLNKYFAFSELNDTVVEAQIRTRQVPPLLPSQTAVEQYMHAKNRLLILVIIMSHNVSF